MSYGNLQQYINVHQNAIGALKALAIPELADFLITLCLRTLDNVTRILRISSHLKTFPLYDDLSKFVVDLSRNSELCQMHNMNVNPKLRIVPKFALCKLTVPRSLAAMFFSVPSVKKGITFLNAGSFKRKVSMKNTTLCVT